MHQMTGSQHKKTYEPMTSFSGINSTDGLITQQLLTNSNLMKDERAGSRAASGGKIVCDIA